MKKLLLSLFVATIATGSITAQVKTPAPSPASTLKQTVGLTEVTVDYSRPGVKGRKIFGDLVPYGKLWRTGANKNTTITFSTNVTIGGKELEKGTYALYSKPNKNAWEVIFYKDTNNWGTPRKWDASKVALSATAKVETMPMPIETFTITIDAITNTGAALGMLWENTYVGLQFTTPTNKGVENSIAKTMAGPSAQDYFDAAGYYYDENKDIAKAQKWIDKAIELTKEKPRFWYIHKQALIHKKAGNKKTAKKAAMLSLELAKKAKYDAYIKKNEDLLKTL